MVFKVEPMDAGLLGIPRAEDAADRGNMAMASAENAGRVAELEHALAFVIAKLVRGEAITLDDEPIRRFLRVPKDAKDDPERYLQAAMASVAPCGMLDCPSCGTKVRDIPGFTKERCPVCGTVVGSKA